VRLRLLICPSTSDKVGDPAAIEDWSSYVYVPGWREGGNPKTVIFYEKKYNHRRTRHELLADGTVRTPRRESQALGCCGRRAP